MKMCNICKCGFESKKRKSLRVLTYDVETKRSCIRTLQGDYCGKCAADVVNKILNTDFDEEIGVDK